jgi:uncharacterized protein DUF222/HNH endonuclease
MASVTASVDHEVIERIDSVFAGISMGHHELLRHIADGDRREIWKNDGCRDMAQWLSGRLGVSNWTARRWVNAAHSIERLPRVSEALESGTLSLDKAVELCRFAAPDTEKKLISWARRVSPAAIRHKADVAARQCLNDALESERARFLRWWWFDDDKRLGIEGEFPAAEGAVIARAIKRLADRLPELPQQAVETIPENRLQQRCADALFAMASHKISEDADADRATIVVHTAIEAGGTPQPGEIEGGPVIHPEITRRLECDGRLRFVLRDENGNALGIGRASRNVPTWLMQQVVHRDRGCTFPGCGRKAFLQAHHIRHWEDGGPTDLYNLTALCHFHHKLVHEFGWTVLLNGSEAEWFRPDGKRFEPGPDPPLPAKQRFLRELIAQSESHKLSFAF